MNSKDNRDIIASLKTRLKDMTDHDKKFKLAKMVPSIFITEGDSKDRYVMSIGGRWTSEKSAYEMLPSVRQYRSALVRELREVEWYIKYLQDDGCFPMGNFNVNTNFMENSNE